MKIIQFIFGIFITKPPFSYFNLDSLCCKSTINSCTLTSNAWLSGRSSGSYFQHCSSTEYNWCGQSSGRPSRSPFSILPITSLFLTRWKGFVPHDKISHEQTPNIHTSLAVVNRLNKFLNTLFSNKTEHAWSLLTRVPSTLSASCPGSPRNNCFDRLTDVIDQNRLA